MFVLSYEVIIFKYGNPVLIARHFHYGVEVFLKGMIIYVPSREHGYVVRVEFQVSGSPRTHCFLWVL